MTIEMRAQFFCALFVVGLWRFASLFTAMQMRCVAVYAKKTQMIIFRKVCLQNCAHTASATTPEHINNLLLCCREWPHDRSYRISVRIVRLFTRKIKCVCSVHSLLLLRYREYLCFYRHTTKCITRIHTHTHTGHCYTFCERPIHVSHIILNVVSNILRYGCVFFFTISRITLWLEFANDNSITIDYFTGFFSFKSASLSQFFSRALFLSSAPFLLALDVVQHRCAQSTTTIATNICWFRFIEISAQLQPHCILCATINRAEKNDTEERREKKYCM